MRFTRLKNAVLGMSLMAVLGLVANITAPIALSQTNTTGDVAGTVADSSGAIVPGATLTLTSLATSATRSTTANSVGEFRFSQLPPGRYTLGVSATGFEQAKQTIDISVGAIAPANFALVVGKNSVTVEVSAGEVPMIHVDDAQISTTFTQEQVENLPNPGNDLTFVAQTAPGSVMNTQGGYGNFSSFGLPGTANTFTVNGGYYDDPFLNVNNSGATNLTLGNNDVASVTVTSNAYNASFGGLGGAQVSEISRSGGNKFHGNAAYWWNGRAMNANDYFDKQGGNPRPFDNVNQWAAAIGGPIIKDKTFFFFNYEGLRVVLPTRSTVWAPDASFISQTLANLTANGLASEIPGYQNIFSLYTSNPNYGNAAVDPNATDALTGGYGLVTFNGEAGNFTHEQKINGRVDQTISDKDHLFGHFSYDNGTQATFTSVLNPLFDALSPQPAWDGQLGEQHIFSPALSNSFLFATNWYQAIFSNTNEAASEKLSPFSLIFADSDLGNNGTAGWPGGLNIVWPQGRKVTGYQFQDDLSWTKGKHTLSVGWALRRDDITDASPQTYTSSPEAVDLAEDFEQGYVDEWYEQFPTRLTQPVALYGMGWYAQDQWRAMPNLTLTYGLRMEHNSNPVCRTACFARLSTDFSSVSTDPTTPYNKLISSGLSKALNDLQKIGWEPRFGFDYLPFGPQSRTTLRGGFGMFADAFPGQIADDFLNNAPTNVPFTILGTSFGGAANYPLMPTTAGSADSVAISSNTAFTAGYANGASNATLSAVPGFSSPNMSSAVSKIYNPSYAEWSMAIEQQLGTKDSITVMYVGNHSYHEPEQNNGVNAFNGSGLAGFAELPTAPPNPNFASVNEISSSSSGNFNGVVFSADHRSRSLTVTVNYQYSHALDDISNGGFDGFTGNSISPDDPFDIRKNYGNADYDTRHYVSGSYIYSLPHYGGPKVLVDNWQFAGTVFHSTGLPFSVLDPSTAGGIGFYGGPLYAKQSAALGGNNHCGGESAANGTACGFANDYVLNQGLPGQPAQSATDFGQSRRNQMFGPNYTDSDFSISKGFGMPGWDSGKLKVGAQFFNLFNHPNFGQPTNTTSGSPGLIVSTVNPPTSILGSFLGGNASPRLIQLNAKFDF
jgi:hypothetical protein